MQSKNIFLIFIAENYIFLLTFIYHCCIMLIIKNRKLECSVRDDFMARKEKVKVTQSLGFNADRPKDRELLSKVNNYASLKINDGIDATSLIRNFLCRKLGEEIQRINSEQAVQTA